MKMHQIQHDAARGSVIMIQGMEKANLQPAIRGKIGDLLDCPVASARVVLSGSKLAEKRCTLTGEGGYFMFSPIPPGVYTLEINCSGFSKLVQRGISVQEHSITGLDLRMDFLEDSRSLKLRALSLEYVDDAPLVEASQPASPLTRELQEVMGELHLARALFNPPAAAQVGRRLSVELGVYQNLKEEIMRRLLERKISRFGDGQIKIVLQGELQMAGCLVLPRSLPEVEIGGSGYVEWHWEALPRISGLGLIRLSLHARVKFAEVGQEERCILALDREVRIGKNVWLEMRRFFSKSKMTAELPWRS